MDRVLINLKKIHQAFLIIAFCSFYHEIVNLYENTNEERNKCISQVKVFP